MRNQTASIDKNEFGFHLLESRRLLDGLQLDAEVIQCNEGNAIELTITRDIASVEQSAVVDLSVSGPGVSGIDASDVPSTVTFSAGVTSRRILIGLTGETPGQIHTLILTAEQSDEEQQVTLFGGMTPEERQAAKDRTKGYEGTRSKAYEDEKGNVTVGVGHNMGKKDEEVSQAVKDKFKRITGADFDDVKNGTRELTNEEIEKLYESDFAKAQATAKSQVPNFDSLPTQIKTVVIDLVFNMGSLNKFTDFKEALSRNDYQQAAWDLTHKNRNSDSADSQYVTDVGQRALDNKAILESVANGTTTGPPQ